MCEGGGEGGWGDGEGYMGNIWIGMELIKADETKGKGKVKELSRDENK